MTRPSPELFGLIDATSKAGAALPGCVCVPRAPTRTGAATATASAARATAALTIRPNDPVSAVGSMFMVPLIVLPAIHHGARESDRCARRVEPESRLRPR